VDSVSNSLSVGEPPTASFTANNVCLGTPVQFSNTSSISACNIGSSISSYKWNFGASSGINSTLMNPSYTYANAGTYNVTLIVVSNFGFSDTLIQTITIYPKPSAAFTAADACLGTAVNFINQSVSADPLNYTWTSNPAGLISSTANPTYLFSGIGSYSISLIAESSFGCKDTMVNALQIFPNPVANFTVPDICLLQQALFINTSTIAVGSMTYDWNFGDNTLNSNQQNPQHTFVNSSVYGVLLTVTSNHLCKDTVEKTVLVKSRPIADYTTDIVSGCATLCVQFTNQTTNQVGPVNSYVWDFGDTKLSTDTNPYHCFTKPGIYTVKLKAASNSTCFDEKTKSNLINVHAVPIADFAYTPNPATVFTSEIHFDNLSVGSTHWQWFFDHNLATSALASPVYVYPYDTAVYMVKLIAFNDDNCSDTISYPVAIGQDFSFYAPSSFSPNEDGNNDVYRISSNGIKSFDMIVMNRLGQVVFSSKSILDAWNGKLNNIGLILAQDVYVYSVKLEDNAGNGHNFRGTITLIR
jgi:gliding motility-associated-like protein